MTRPLRVRDGQLAEQLRRQHGLRVIVENKARVSGTLGGQCLHPLPARGLDEGVDLL